MKNKGLLLLGAIVMLAACKKDDSTSPAERVNFKVQHIVDAKSLELDTLKYINSAGEIYSVTTLHYYLSGFRFFRNGSQVGSVDTVIYVDARKQTSFHFNGPVFSEADSVACFIGVDPEHNHHGMLPPTQENTIMEWPEPMGGGYHFIKLEGHWKSANTTEGYAMHIGLNPFLIEAGSRLNKIIHPNDKTIVVTMNVAEWFRNPYTYSFEQDGVYSMGDTLLMKRLQENGSHTLSMTVEN